MKEQMKWVELHFKTKQTLIHISERASQWAAEQTS